MNNRIHLNAMLLLLAVLVSLATFMHPGNAGAQPCPGVKVTNQTPCAVNLCLVDPAGVMVCQMIPAMTAGFPFPLPAGFVINGVQSFFGNLYVFPLQPPSPACTPCIQVSQGCCGRVCYDQPTCRIGIQVCGPPCLP